MHVCMYACMYVCFTSGGKNWRLFESKTAAMNSNEILKFCCMHVQHIVFAAVCHKIARIYIWYVNRKGVHSISL